MKENGTKQREEGREEMARGRFRRAFLLRITSRHHSVHCASGIQPLVPAVSDPSMLGNVSGVAALSVVRWTVQLASFQLARPFAAGTFQRHLLARICS